MFLAKDFIETAEGLVFAVVENGLEQSKVLCFLRYVNCNGEAQKVNTEQANLLLSENHPEYIYYSRFKDAYLHAVNVDKIVKHHRPRARLKKILADKGANDVENDLLELCHLFERQGINLDTIGITGSVLISAQRQSSDLDLVFYSREVFYQARQITRELVHLGDCTELSEADWRESYDRRSCDLSYAEYLWHEKRKFNKAVISQRKFDLNFVLENEGETTSEQYTKLKPIKLKVQVIDDTFAYDYPAEFYIDHPEIKSIVCYTATYTGQAQTGEWVEVSGTLESVNGIKQRIVVGSTREANGQYIKVINEK